MSSWNPNVGSGSSINPPVSSNTDLATRNTESAEKTKKVLQLFSEKLNLPVEQQKSLTMRQLELEKKINKLNKEDTKAGKEVAKNPKIKDFIAQAKRDAKEFVKTEQGRIDQFMTEAENEVYKESDEAFLASVPSRTQSPKTSPSTSTQPSPMASLESTPEPSPKSSPKAASSPQFDPKKLEVTDLQIMQIFPDLIGENGSNNFEQSINDLKKGFAALLNAVIEEHKANSESKIDIYNDPAAMLKHDVQMAKRSEQFIKEFADQIKKIYPNDDKEKAFKLKEDLDLLQANWYLKMP